MCQKCLSKHWYWWLNKSMSLIRKIWLTWILSFYSLKRNLNEKWKLMKYWPWNLSNLFLKDCFTDARKSHFHGFFQRSTYNLQAKKLSKANTLEISHIHFLNLILIRNEGVKSKICEDENFGKKLQSLLMRITGPNQLNDILKFLTLLPIYSGEFSKCWWIKTNASQKYIKLRDFNH